jgi:hypothetical protein
MQWCGREKHGTFSMNSKCPKPKTDDLLAVELAVELNCYDKDFQSLKSH